MTHPLRRTFASHFIMGAETSWPSANLGAPEPDDDYAICPPVAGLSGRGQKAKSLGPIRITRERLKFFAPNWQYSSQYHFHEGDIKF